MFFYGVDEGDVILLGYFEFLCVVVELVILSIYQKTLRLTHVPQFSTNFSLLKGFVNDLLDLLLR